METPSVYPPGLSRQAKVTRKVCLLGGGPLLLKLALGLSSESLEITVITSPRQASERIEGARLDAWLREKDVKFHSISVFEPDAVNQVLGDAKGFCFVSIGAAWIFPAHVLTGFFGGELYNVHGARLPEGRGGGGFSWQIMSGARFGACTIHRVDGGVDTGAIVVAKEILYPPTARIPQDFFDFYVAEALDFVSGFIRKLAQGVSFADTAQQNFLSSYWPRLHSETNGLIDWSWSASEIERFICAFDDPYQGAATFLEGKKVFLKNVVLSHNETWSHPFQDGLVIRKSDRWLCVAVDGSVLVVQDIKDEKGGPILSGIRLGQRFMTPQSALEKAKERVVITPNGVEA